MVYTVVGLSINPERQYKYLPKDFGITDHAESFIQTTDDYKILVWEFTAKRNLQNKVIIISGGDSGNMAYGLYYVKNLLDQGYTVITYDYRGFGHSDDFKTESNYLYYNEYANDLKAVLCYTKEKYGSSNIGLLSFSMGTIISTLVLLHEQVGFLIAENFVHIPSEVKNRLLKQKDKICQLPEKLVDFRIAVKDITCPMLLFAGKDDVVTTVSDSQKIVNEKPSIRRLIIHKGGHAEGLLVLTKEETGDLYFEEIHKFLTLIDK